MMDRADRKHEWALAHPVRRTILKTMLAPDVGPISPKELSEQNDIHLANISYHVRELAAADVITLVDTVPVRGTIQHFYAVNDPTHRRFRNLL